MLKKGQKSEGRGRRQGKKMTKTRNEERDEGRRSKNKQDKKTFRQPDDHGLPWASILDRALQGRDKVGLMTTRCPHGQ